MARQQKAAYVRPIKDSSVVAGRVSEQVCGRLVHHYTETFKKGTSKSVAVLVDDNALRSVLVLEAWSVADQTHMQNALLKHAGEVVCLTNFKVQSRGRLVKERVCFLHVSVVISSRGEQNFNGAM